MVLPEERADYSEVDAIGVGAEVIRQELFDVCAGTEGLAVLAADDNNLNSCLMVELSDCLHDVVDHGLRERVEVFGAVEPDGRNFLVPRQLDLGEVVLRPARDSLLQKIQSIH